MSRFAASPARRFATVPGVVAMAGGMTVTMPAWLPIALVVDVVRTRSRLPITRLLCFGLVWSWLETVGVVVAGGLWVSGHSSRRDAHYAVQRWWARRLVDGLRLLCDLQIEVEGIDALDGGPLVICGRHSSLADSLLPAWMLGERGTVRPRYVMKRELLLDPCLDIVGNRVPNYFVDRGAHDTGPELDDIEGLARDMGPRDAAVIFPEGGVGGPAKQWRAMAKLMERDPERAVRLAALTHLLPPRSKGTAALLRGAPDADLVLMAHVGLEGLDRIATVAEHIPLRAPVRVRLQRIPRAEMPPESELADWLDEKWLEMDAWIESTRGAGLVLSGR
ncbi:MAG: 1-acyl-sn-glycerol-3-phosphate acyltransferase [Acidimicrobiia bacterium]